MNFNKVLITGGSGFIGSFLCEKLLEFGYEVTVLDNFSTGTPGNLSELSKDIRLVDGDIRNFDIVDTLAANTEYIVHLAAALGVSNIMENPIDSISTNIYGSEIVLQAANRYSVPIFIASTSEIYGKNPIQPLDEESDRVIGTPQNYRWSYSDSKAIEESMARVLFERNGLQVVTARFFNTVGPRQTGKYGMVIPRFVESAIAGGDLVVNGDGNQTRVFCHVKDAVEAIYLLMQAENVSGEVFNIGGQGEMSINSLAQKIIVLCKSNSLISYKSYNEVYGLGFEDMQRRVPNINKITKFTGWTPTKKIDEIILDVRDSLTSK